MYKAYTGVGSRSTPTNIRSIIFNLAAKLSEEGYILRSGGADGADTYFQDGWLISEDRAPAEIYIPWKRFNGRYHGQWGAVIESSSLAQHILEEAENIASSIHPAWDKCSRGAKALHTRNVFQVLGKELNNPSKFLVCWAEMDKQGKPKGGTRTAWMLAEKYDIPCFNLYKVEHRERIEKWLVKE